MHSSGRSISALIPGFLSVFRGIRLVFSTRGFRRYVVFPFIINVIILSSGVYFAVAYLYPFLHSMIPNVDNVFIHALRIIAKPLFVCVVILFSILVYSFTGTIVCAPFLDFVSRKTERLCGGKDPQTGESIIAAVKSVVVTLRNTAGLLLFFLTFNVIILFLNFIPVIGSVFYAMISFFTLMLFIGYQFYDINVERHGFPFASKFEIMWENRWSCVGIGIAFMLLTYIPVIGFLATVGATSGAAIVFCDKESVN